MIDNIIQIFYIFIGFLFCFVFSYWPIICKKWVLNSIMPQRGAWDLCRFILRIQVCTSPAPPVFSSPSPAPGDSFFSFYWLEIWNTSWSCSISSMAATVALQGDGLPLEKKHKRLERKWKLHPCAITYECFYFFPQLAYFGLLFRILK